MRNPISKCLAMGFIVVLFSSPAFADTSIEAKLAIIASKLAQFDAALVRGPCAKCAAGIAVAQADVEKLAGQPNFRKEDRAMIVAINAKIKAMSAKLDKIETKIGALGAGFSANAMHLGMAGVFGTGVMVADARSESEEEEEGAAPSSVNTGGSVACPVGYNVDADMSFRQSRHTLRARKHVKCSPMVLPAAVLAPLPPVVSSSRTIAGWVLSTLGGAATLGVASWWIANKASPVVVTDDGVDGGMGPPVALLGAVIGGLVGAGVYALATSE